jgi:hypothetical protein
MNHSSKISLVLLLIPIYNNCSQAESKALKGVTFIPGKKQTDTASGVVVQANVNNGTLIQQPKASDDAAVSAVLAASSTSDDTTVVVTPITAAAAAAASGVATNIETTTKVGDPYRFRLVPQQTADYIAGKDGISKLLKLENSSTYIDRLIGAGKFASAAKHQPDSFLSDHIRRDLEAKNDALATTSRAHSASTIDLTQKQRLANIQLFGALSALLQAIKEHAPREITPGAIDVCIQTAQKSITENDKLLETISQEVCARTKFLTDIIEQLKAVKSDQQTHAK